MKCKTQAIALLATATIALSACSGELTESATPDVVPAVPVLAQGEVSSYRDVSVEEASALITGEPPAQVIDVRTPAEFAQGHIEGAINIDVKSETFLEDLAKLDKGATYVLHCKSGARSARALEAMKGESFNSVAHMNSGFDGWTGAGLPTAQ